MRDCLFAVAGSLDSRMGGPAIDHHLGLTVPRRSLYFQHAAEKQMEFLQIFDGAGVTECYRRKESILPQQALAPGQQRSIAASGPPPGADARGTSGLRFREFRDRRVRAGARSLVQPMRNGLECLTFLGEIAGMGQYESRRVRHTNRCGGQSSRRPTRS